MVKAKCIITDCKNEQKKCKLCDEHYNEAFKKNKSNIAERFKRWL